MNPVKNIFLSIVVPFSLFGSLAIAPFSCLPTHDGGVWRSSDHGDNWEQKVAITKKQNIATANILSIKVDPQDSKIIYLGTKGDGLYKSMDNGEIWYKISDGNFSLSKQANIYDIAIDSQNPNFLYLGAYQDRFGRVFRSRDAGRNWEEIYRVSREKYAVFAVEIDSFNPAVIYVGTAEGGLLKSSDYGRSWRVIKWFDRVIADIKINPRDNQEIYVRLYQRGIYKSVDQGASWQILENLDRFSEASELESLAMDMVDPNVLYVGCRSGLLKSPDGGLSWQKVNIIIPPNSVPVTATVVNGSALYYAAGHVVYRSWDNGQTWTSHPIATSQPAKVLIINQLQPNVLWVGIGKK